MSGTRILIVDDEQRMRKLVRDYMIREGYSVLEASNGRDAMKLFDSEGNIALIILVNYLELLRLGLQLALARGERFEECQRCPEAFRFHVRQLLLAVHGEICAV